MKYFFISMFVTLLVACSQTAVPEGEMERLRASLPSEQDPPAAYNRQGISVP